MVDRLGTNLGEKIGEKLVPAPTLLPPGATLDSRLGLGLGAGAGARLEIKARQETELKLGVNLEREVSFETEVGLSPKASLGTGVRPGERPGEGEAGASRTNEENQLRAGTDVPKPRH